MERRTFLARLGQTLVAMPVMTIPLGCGGSDDATVPTGTGGGPAITATGTGSGHQHTVVLACTELSNGTQTYSSSFSGGHDHTVTLTANEVSRVLAGELVVVQTSDGHTHSWSIQQPSGLCP